MQFYEEFSRASHGTRVRDISIDEPLVAAVALLVSAGLEVGAKTFGSMLSTAHANKVLSDLIGASSVGPLVETSFAMPCRLTDITLVGGSAATSDGERTEVDHPYSELAGDGWDADLRTRLMATPLHGGLVIGLSDEAPVELRYRSAAADAFETKRVGRGEGLYWTGPLVRQPLRGGEARISGIYLSFNPTFVHRSTGLLRSIPAEHRQQYDAAARRILGIGDRYPKIYPVSALVQNQEAKVHA
ncbi:hypothetical protein [Rhizobium leguminosarum]|uniref:hypothetical protein n=1 Tax=Rhizobium leguminosarum TaxID=384 RepID=UPI002E0D4A9D|nr:hypothetical protein U8Q02_36555 [Rhizobium leguminosarum]